MKKSDTFKCSICGDICEGWGNNAEPINDGTCCDACNETIVIPARIMKLDGERIVGTVTFDANGDVQGLIGVMGVRAYKELDDKIYSLMVEVAEGLPTRVSEINKFGRYIKTIEDDVMFFKWNEI